MDTTERRIITIKDEDLARPRGDPANSHYSAPAFPPFIRQPYIMLKLVNLAAMKGRTGKNGG